MSSIQVVKLTMGFQPANSRPSCRNCIHGDESYADRMPPYNTKTWRCKKGGFGTSAMAICKQHQPTSHGGAKP